MTATALSRGWIEFDGKNMLPPINEPVLAYWTFQSNDGECQYAVAAWNGHYWINPDDDEDDYRDPAYWMRIPDHP